MYLAEQNATLSLFFFRGTNCSRFGRLVCQTTDDLQDLCLNSFAGEQRVQISVCPGSESMHFQLQCFVAC